VRFPRDDHKQEEMIMDAAAYQPNEDQTAHWNGRAGQAWTEAEALIDALFRPIEQLIADTAAALHPASVLDVGCGTGSTTLAIARRLGGEARCVGIDISEPMLAAARARAGREGVAASFVRADAQTHGFTPASFDLIASRFGVMFFDDPVRAFANLRQAAMPGAQLRLVTWRGAAENPFMLAAERAAAPLLPTLPAREPNGPGQFAFADEDRVRRILEESGWTDIDLAPVDIVCSMPEKDLTFYFTRLGPLAKILPDLDDQTRARVIETVRPAFDPYVRGSEIRFTAACWMISARALSR
jgi:SAM-dependent methyltransferase